MRCFTDKRIFIFVCLNAALYALILVFDIMRATRGVTEAQGLLCDSFKYAAIISCLLICLIARTHSRRDTARIQAVVFCFTLAADYALLFTDFFATGVLFFLGAHAFALYRYRPRWLLPAGAVAAALFFLTLLLLPRLLRADGHLTLVVAVCVAYAVLIISVTISTFHAPQPRINTLFSRGGMLLFICCDINVAIFNALPYGSIPHTFSTVLMWAFYLPAQTLLALSATDLKAFCLLRRTPHPVSQDLRKAPAP